jgi:hypothetical protein
MEVCRNSTNAPSVVRSKSGECGITPASSPMFNSANTAVDRYAVIQASS